MREATEPRSAPLYYLVGKAMRKDSTHLTRRALIGGAVGVTLSSLVTPADAIGDLVVVVHPSNRETPSMSDLVVMFTTRRQSWSGGKRVVPFNFPAKHDLRIAFDKSVLHMEPDDVARYWIDRRIRGGNSPPKQVGSAQLIVRLVEKLDGAIAYVPTSVLTPKVRVVRAI